MYTCWLIFKNTIEYTGGAYGQKWSAADIHAIITRLGIPAPPGNSIYLNPANINHHH